VKFENRNVPLDVVGNEGKNVPDDYDESFEMDRALFDIGN